MLKRRAILLFALAAAGVCCAGARAAVTAPDLRAIYDAAAAQYGAANAATVAKLRALGPASSDSERLEAALEGALAAGDPVTFKLLEPQLDAALRVARRDGLQAAEAVLLTARHGPGSIMQGGVTDAQMAVKLAALAQAAELARRSGDGTARCYTLYHQGYAHMLARRPPVEMATHVGAAAAVGEAAPRCAALALADMARGLLTRIDGAGTDSGTQGLDQALGLFARAIELSPPDAFPSQGGYLLWARGQRLEGAGRFAEAEADCRRSEALAKRAADDDAVTLALVCQSRVQWAQHRPRDAVSTAERAKRLADAGGSALRKVQVEQALARALAWLPSPDVAAVDAALQRAWTVIDALGQRTGERGVELARAAASVYAQLGRYQQAYEYAQQAAQTTSANLSQAQIASIAELGAKLDLQGKQAEIDKLALREAEATTRRNALAIGLVFAVLALTIVALLLRRQTQQKRQITALYTQLEALNADRSRFLAAACHDLRQPTYALSLLAQVARNAPERSAHYLDDIQRNALVLGDMLGEVMDLTQLERGDYRAAPSPVNLDALLAEAAAQYRSIAERRGLALQVVPCGQWVVSDPYLLRRIVFNLVSNACKYTDRGGVQLDVVVADGNARVRVSDTGRGIPPDRIQDMLRPYTRLDHGAAEEGLGIGLSVVQQASQLLGHPLKIDSVVGRGTTVSLEMPVTPAPLPGSASAADEDAPVHGLVAIVDDSEEIRETLASLLRDWGLDSIAAASGRALLEALRDGGHAMPALLLTDYQLGAETGLDVVRALRAQPGWERLPAVMVTGSVSVEAEDAARSAGVTMLFKPAHPARLRRAMAEALQREAA